MMPCYCDVPEENEQVEIERRCKERMYFDSQKLLDINQLNQCEKRKLKRFPIGDVTEHLCKLCEILTDEQMKIVMAYYWQIKWTHKTLFDWYEQHKKDDELMSK